MQNRRPIALVLGLVLTLALGLVSCRRHSVHEKPASSPLFTGHEARHRVWLTFPSGSKPGFVNVGVEIYATTSLVAQAKQVLMALMAGPPQGNSSGAVSCFAPGASFLELYLIPDRGLAVVDLPSATVDALPGGTSCEVAVLYCLVHTLCADVPKVSKVQVLIDGQPAESLRGHFDLQDPLGPSDF
ncbi:MAG: GerMN domain-containing protein [bacterium]